MRKKPRKISWMAGLKPDPRPEKEKPTNRKKEEHQNARHSRQKAPRIARKHPSITKTRKALLAAYKASYAQIPDTVQCPVCGLPKKKAETERHHPAGRRKAAFCFTVQVCRECHSRIHADPKWAEASGLLWKGRNSKTLDVEAASRLSASMPYPQTYPVEIMMKFRND